jgi:hypothetical protein
MECRQVENFIKKINLKVYLKIMENKLEPLLKYQEIMIC